MRPPFVLNIVLQVRNLELLKLRFGESNLYFCEVMIKDIADSKRINSHIVSQLKKEREGKTREEVCVDACMLCTLLKWVPF